MDRLAEIKPRDKVFVHSGNVDEQDQLPVKIAQQSCCPSMSCKVRDRRSKLLQEQSVESHHHAADKSVDMRLTGC